MYKKCEKFVLAFALLAMAACKGNSDSSESSTLAPKEPSVASQSYTIAFVDTDTLFAKYLMVEEVKKDLEKVETKLMNDYKNQVTSFQKEYENYLKVGASMTLAEQKKKEEYLSKRQQELVQMETKYAQQLQEMQLQKNGQVQDKVFSFIEGYNKENANYTIILSKSRTSGVLYSEPSMDITKEVIEAMNAAYKKGNK